MKKYIIPTILIILFSFLLSSCAPQTEEKAKEKMKEKGYSSIDYRADQFSETPEKEGVLGGVLFMNPVTENYLMVVYFETRADAKRSFSTYSDNIKENLDIGNVDFQAVLSGKMIYIGTDGAIRDFKAV
jgi:hypothetical protein